MCQMVRSARAALRRPATWVGSAAAPMAPRRRARCLPFPRPWPLCAKSPRWRCPTVSWPDRARDRAGTRSSAPPVRLDTETGVPALVVGWIRATCRFAPIGATRATPHWPSVSFRPCRRRSFAVPYLAPAPCGAGPSCRVRPVRSTGATDPFAVVVARLTAIWALSTTRSTTRTATATFPNASFRSSFAVS